MEEKHTLGPWKAVDKRPQCAGFSIFHESQFVAFVGDSDHLTPAAANAILIAAAPDLLEVLQEIVKTSYDAGAVNIARAAIAKATQ